LWLAFRRKEEGDKNLTVCMLSDLVFFSSFPFLSFLPSFLPFLSFIFFSTRDWTRTLHILGKYSTTWTVLPAILFVLFVWPWIARSSCLNEIKDVCHHIWLEVVFLTKEQWMSLMPESLGVT
jgi:hypothetical protein